MAPAKKGTKEVLVGSEAVKVLQEKQVDNLEKGLKAMTNIQDGFDDAVLKGKAELNELYYQIKDKEAELVKMEADKVAELATTDASQLTWRKAEVAKLQANINALEKEFEVKFQDFEVSFNLKIRESKDNTLNELLDEFNLAYISDEELSELKDDLATITSKVNKKKDAAIGVVTANAEKQRKADLAALELKHTAETAKLEAQNENAEKQLEFFKEQLDAAKVQYKDLLDTNVKVAEASKAVVVNGGGK